MILGGVLGVWAFFLEGGPIQVRMDGWVKVPGELENESEGIGQEEDTAYKGVETREVPV